MDQEHDAEARDRLKEAITWQQKALSANPKQPRYRQFLANHFTNLMKVARALNDQALAVEAQRGLDKLSGASPSHPAPPNTQP
jgi:hypothetical protein